MIAKRMRRSSVIRTGVPVLMYAFREGATVYYLEGKTIAS